MRRVRLPLLLPFFRRPSHVNTVCSTCRGTHKEGRVAGTRWQAQDQVQDPVHALPLHALPRRPREGGEAEAEPPPWYVPTPPLSSPSVCLNPSQVSTSRSSTTRPKRSKRSGRLTFSATLLSPLRYGPLCYAADRPRAALPYGCMLHHDYSNMHAWHPTVPIVLSYGCTPSGHMTESTRSRITPWLADSWNEFTRIGSECTVTGMYSPS